MSKIFHNLMQTSRSFLNRYDMSNIYQIYLLKQYKTPLISNFTKRPDPGKFQTEIEKEILFINIFIGDHKRLGHKIFIKLLLFMEPQNSLKTFRLQWTWKHGIPRFEVKFLDLERNPRICRRILGFGVKFLDLERNPRICRRILGF